MTSDPATALRARVEVQVHPRVERPADDRPVGRPRRGEPRRVDLDAALADLVAGAIPSRGEGADGMTPCHPALFSTTACKQTSNHP
jgi:hypothetical protein